MTAVVCSGHENVSKGDCWQGSLFSSKSKEPSNQNLWFPQPIGRINPKTRFRWSALRHHCTNGEIKMALTLNVWRKLFYYYEMKKSEISRWSSRFKRNCLKTLGGTLQQEICVQLAQGSEHHVSLCYLGRGHLDHGQILFCLLLKLNNTLTILGSALKTLALLSNANATIVAGIEH